MAKKARVFVTLKRGVLDPQGSAVNRALHAMGYGEVSDVRLGKVVELTLDGKVPEAQERARIEEMCKKLLANTVIEDYRIDL
ncbi:MAG TPA: phosphoribosylformylglycinamidine synthase subunit PurS [Anaeromyxobacter sp.]|nr:phosphoribosylformylglycinamidine synthase subunit PurS [Anaeromyxobacter sp.]